MYRLKDASIRYFLAPFAISTEPKSLLTRHFNCSISAFQSIGPLLSELVSLVPLTLVSRSNNSLLDYINSDNDDEKPVRDGPNLVHILPNTLEGSEDGSGPEEDASSPEEDANDSEEK